MGGRMTSEAQALDPLPNVLALVFLGFPLHPPKRPATARAGHLASTTLPLLFVQGTRDDLADLALMRETVGALGHRATLHEIEGADHSFKIGGRRDAIEPVANLVSSWILSHAM